MAITLDHVENQALSWTDASPAKGVTSVAVIDAGANKFYDYVNIALSVQMDANIDGSGVDIKVRYSPDSGSFTDPDTNITLFNIAAAEATYVYNIRLEKFNYAELCVYNNTTTEGEVTPTGEWEGCTVADS